MLGVILSAAFVIHARAANDGGFPSQEEILVPLLFSRPGLITCADRPAISQRSMDDELVRHTWRQLHVRSCAVPCNQLRRERAPSSLERTDTPAGSSGGLEGSRLPASV